MKKIPGIALLSLAASAYADLAIETVSLDNGTGMVAYYGKKYSM